MIPLFGRIALEKGYLSEDGLDELLRVYGRYEGRYPMGRIALKRGLLSEEQVAEVLALQVAHVRLERAESGGPAPVRPAAAPAAAPAVAGGGGLSGPDTQQPVRTEASTLSMDLAQLLRTAMLAGASDLHLHTDEVPRVRVGTELVPLEGVAARDARELTEMFGTLVPPPLFEAWERDLEVDFARDVEPGLRVRGNLYHERRGPAACLRLIGGGPPHLDDLGLPQDLARFATFHNGLVLFTGPARCGKSTTLAALVDLVNEERKQTIICIEDPVEVVHEGRQATVLQREVGHHTASFGTALRAALREDPDVIVVGELRDFETISLAITAAETGHLVFGTVHTRNVMETVSRLVDVFPPEQQEHVRGMLAESLRGVISQVLFPTREGRLVPVLEILTRHSAVATCIRENKLHQLPSVMQTNRRAGMRPFSDSIAELHRAGVIDDGERDALCELLTEV